ncbi:DNA repair protein RecO [Flavihumibacter sp. CACIAM 22H1]|uniref:DNA repair protein RecO n=1 Tax=Flavihumibacter sp. CACIAM 22H1 TaxID=1812911 RepID=UPI0007A87C13|nr:DNA repair protein RecO [Flavihumibacter sp. CACIAM 22H1]KYP13837.1 MAG: DNA repair protein RecO [Flavihumibacter sp. CACIAM 22H1]
MNFHTKGIVLRTVKYGETSVIVSIFTELFGMQSYIVNGVRSSSKKAGTKANLFQPVALLDLVVYHQEQKNLQRIKEHRWATLYQHLFFDVFKGSVATYMVELLQKCLKQPEPHPDLFYFMEDALLHLDQASPKVVANYPLFFSLHLANFFGFRMVDAYDDKHTILDLQEGLFTDEQPLHTNYLEGFNSEVIAQLLRVMQPGELEQIHLPVSTRRFLLLQMELYYSLHITDFGQLRSMPVLQEVLS